MLILCSLYASGAASPVCLSVFKVLAPKGLSTLYPPSTIIDLFPRLLKQVVNLSCFSVDLYIKSFESTRKPFQFNSYCSYNENLLSCLFFYYPCHQIAGCCVFDEAPRAPFYRPAAFWPLFKLSLFHWKLLRFSRCLAFEHNLFSC